MPEPQAPADIGELDRIEFEALRATIRERGTVRLCVAAATFLVWGALAVAISLSEVVPVLSLIGVLVLAAGFEVILAVHVGVERLGRYVQVFYEERPGALGPRWESTAMAYGRAYPGAGPDPLFGGLFLLAIALNYLFVALVGVTPELIGLGAVHLLLPCRLLLARRHAARQREEDLQRFRRLVREQGNGKRGTGNAEGGIGVANGERNP